MQLLQLLRKPTPWYQATTVLALCLWLLCSTLVASENEPAATANRIIAGYLAKLPKFMIFEEESKAPIVVAIVGEDPNQLTLTLRNWIAADPYARGRIIECRHIPYIPNPFKAKDEPNAEDFDARNMFIESLQSTNLIFITSEEEWVWRDVILKTSGASVLTVARGRSFTKVGGMVSLLIRDNRLQFQINIDILAEEGLTLSSQLLKHAQLVRKDD